MRQLFPFGLLLSYSSRCCRVAYFSSILFENLRYRTCQRPAAIALQQILPCLLSLTDTMVQLLYPPDHRHLSKDEDPSLVYCYFPCIQELVDCKVIPYVASRGSQFLYCSVFLHLHFTMLQRSVHMRSLVYDV